MKRSFYNKHALLILCFFFAMTPVALLGARRALLSNRNQVAEWLPHNYPETKQFMWFKDHFAGEEFLLVSWEGCTLDDDRLQLLTSKLMAPPKPEPPVPAAPAWQFWKRWDRGGIKRTDKPLFDSVMTGGSLLQRMTTPPINLPRDEALERLRGSLIGQDLNQTCAVFSLSPDGREHPRQSVETVIATATAECGIPLHDLHMGGPPVDNVAIDKAGEQSLARLAGLAAGIGLLISWWCLRSFRLVAMVFFSGVFAAATSLAIVYYSGGTVNAILLTMPSLVYVATISGSIHLSNYYRDTVLEEGLEGAAGKAIKHATLALCLATGTTAVGLGSLMYGDLQPIQYFGLYSAIGVVVSLLVLYLYMPAAFEMWPLDETQVRAQAQSRSKVPDPFLSPWWRKAGYWVLDHNGLVTTVCMVVMVVSGWGFTHSTTTVQLMKLFKKDAPLIGDYRWLENKLGPLVPMEVIIKVDPDLCELNFLERMELVQRIQDEVEAQPEVGSALSAVTFAPNLPIPEDFRPAGGLGGVLERIAVKDKYGEARKRFNERLTRHRGDYLGNDYLSEDGRFELWRVSARIGALSGVDYGTFVDNLKNVVEPVVDTERAHGVKGVEVIYTGLVPLIYHAQHTMLEGLMYGFIGDFTLVTIVMVMAVRRLAAGPLLLLPSIFPAVFVFGMMGWLGISIDIGTLMTPAVALGVTVDDVVHFMLKFRNALQAGETRREAVMTAYDGCARAMYQSWGVIGLGMSVFAFSPFTPTQRFGYLMVSLLTAALVGNLLLLPALLAGPLGALFGLRLKKPVAAGTPPSGPHTNGRPTPARKPHASITSE